MKEDKFGSYSAHYVDPDTMANLTWYGNNILVETKCPWCNGFSKIESELTHLKYLTVSKWVIWVYLQCRICKAKHTTTELDNINFKPIIERKNRTKQIIKIIKTLCQKKLQTAI